MPNDLLVEEAIENKEEPSNLMAQVKTIIDDTSYQIIIYKHYHNLKFHEIATIMETTTSVVNNKYQRAIKKLKTELREEDLYE